jgi:hypothetical protein
MLQLANYACQGKVYTLNNCLYDSVVHYSVFLLKRHAVESFFLFIRWLNQETSCKHRSKIDQSWKSMYAHDYADI